MTNRPFNVRFGGLEKLDRGIGRIPGAYNDLIVAIAESVRDEATEAAKPHSQDTGDIAGGITMDILGGEKNPRGARVFVTNKGAGAAEIGRAPGRMPPPDELRQWVASHAPGVPVFVIAQAIAKRGTRKIRYMAQAVRATKKKIPGMIAKIEAGLEAAWS